ncbi:hypothetical protein ABMA28_010155 [Loxostege sticticalis]|uniref:Attacin C-terminal domain-containing protein n=1 Tax=Loxostege sticticalis TaxID=481309 RepID=A0ABD0S9V8_LOXSC
MEAQGSLTKDLSGKNLTMGLTNGVASGNVFVNGYKDANPKAVPRPTGPSFADAGANLGVKSPSGGAQLEATNIPKFGNQLTASAKVNLVNHNDHKVDAHAFVTKNLREGPVPNYTSHGGGVNYSYKDTVGLGASRTSIPIAKMHENSVTGNVNLHNTPTSSLDLNVGARQTTSPFGRGQWQQNGALTFRKQF